MRKIALTADEIIALRKQIVLNSIYYADYQNDFDVDSHDVCDFFDGFLEFITCEAEENGENYDNDFSALLAKYDNEYYLREWCSCFDDAPLYRIENNWEVTFTLNDGSKERYLLEDCEDFYEALDRAGETAYMKFDYDDGVWTDDDVWSDNNFVRTYNEWCGEIYLKKGAFELREIA